ncbi:MAG: YfhO family protein, partial [bacterium]|nr:YfhO family protein [bacterium]
PIPATGNELALANVGILNAYTPLVTDRWHRVAREYAARGLGEIDNASVRLRNILAITRTNAIIAPDSFTGGEGFENLDFDLTSLFPNNWHVIKTPDPVDYISVPRYVEAWSETHWDWFKHWITEPGYVPGESVCVEVDENTVLPDGMEWAEPLTPVGDFDPLLPATGGFELNPESVCEITAVTRDIYGAPVMYIDVNADQACWVVIRESNMPGWTATVDGKPARISTADFLFMGVPVPDGSHQIKLVYRTPGLAAGGWISGAGWLIFLLMIGLTVVIQRKKS